MALFSPRVEALVPTVDEAAADKVDDQVAAGTPAGLRADLERLLGAERVLSSAADLVRYASDASPYRLIPQAVVMAQQTDDIAKVLDYGRRNKIPVTFRAAGTSLNGQAQSDGILVDVRRHWAGVKVEQGGAVVRARPGTILGRVNAALVRHGRKMGPDPASTSACTVGGVVANNATGFTAGTVRSSYATLLGATFVLPSGTVIDTTAPGAEELFAEREPVLAQGLMEIKAELEEDEDLAARVRRKFSMKNTTAYRLDAFLDADTPLEIFRRLLVGSEGTLAFIAEVVMKTVKPGTHAATGFIVFPDFAAAGAAVPDLAALGAWAVELVGSPTLTLSRQFFEGTPQWWDHLAPEAAALLVEFRTDDEAKLEELESKARVVFAQHGATGTVELTRDPKVAQLYWEVREALAALLARQRPEGSVFIAEDVCVPPDRIAEAIADVRALQAKHGWIVGAAGHAMAGNLHFPLTPRFGVPEDRERYDAFMNDLVELIVGKYDGSLKAEHSCGRNMAPFVAREWGEKATSLFWRIKRLADPHGVLNPDVILSNDPGIHLKNLKTTPTVESEIDPCIECGFCEPVCPSRDVTTTPRQRIALRREMTRQPTGSPVTAALLAAYEHDAIETCAGDAACAIACPLGIDTGVQMKEFRAVQHSPRANRIALALAKQWKTVEGAARLGIRSGQAVSAIGGHGLMRRLTSSGRKIVSPELLPMWSAAIPKAAKRKLPATQRDGAAAVYFPACINRIFGPPEDGLPSLPSALVAVAERAGKPIWIPDDVAGNCCATVWHSKGYYDGNVYMANHVVESMWRWSDGGQLPVVVDATSCTHGLLHDVARYLNEDNSQRFRKLRILDSIGFARDELLESLAVRRKLPSVVLHPSCSVHQLKLADALREVAERLADEVVVPDVATCCGMAGDRGLLHPELTAAATAEEAAEVIGRSFDAYLGSNRTCEVGLQDATGAAYTSFIYQLEKLTRP